mgnify:FL=1
MEMTMANKTREIRMVERLEDSQFSMENHSFDNEIG